MTKASLWSILTQAAIGGKNGKVLVVVSASSGQERWSNAQKALPKLHHSPGPQRWRRAGMSVSWAIGNHATPGLLRRLPMPCSRIGMTHEATQTSWEVCIQNWTQSCFCTEYSVDSVFWIKQGTRGKTVCCINTPTIKMHPGLILNVLWIAGVCLCCGVLLAIFLYTKCIHLSIPQKSVRSFIKQKRKITGVCFSLGKNETFQQLNAVFLILGNYIKLQ